jgi:hypothetical protein
VTTKHKPKLNTGAISQETKREINANLVRNLERFLSQLMTQHQILSQIKSSLSKTFNPYDSIKSYLDFIQEHSFDENLLIIQNQSLKQ